MTIGLGSNHTMVQAVPLIPVHIPSPTKVISTVFNPFEWLNSRLTELIGYALKVIQNIIVYPPQAVSASWQDYLFGNALGLSQYLTLTCAMVAWVIAAFLPQRAISALKALIVMIIVYAVGASFYPFYGWLQSVGPDIASHLTIMNHSSSGSKTSVVQTFLVMPKINNIIGSLSTLSTLGWMAMLISIIFYMYQVCNVIVGFLFPVLFAGIILGGFFKKAIDLCISLALVSCVLAQPISKLIVLIAGNFAINAQTGALPASLVGTFTLIAAMFILVIAQLVLIWLTYRGVNNVTGRIQSQITGVVEATINNITKVDVESFNSNHANGMQAIDYGAPEKPGSATKHVVKELAFVAAAGAVGTAIGNPELGLAAKEAASHHYRSKAR